MRKRKSADCISVQFARIINWNLIEFNYYCWTHILRKWEAGFNPLQQTLAFICRIFWRENDMSNKKFGA